MEQLAIELSEQTDKLHLEINPIVWCRHKECKAAEKAMTAQESQGSSFNSQYFSQRSTQAYSRSPDRSGGECSRTKQHGSPILPESMHSKPYHSSRRDDILHGSGVGNLTPFLRRNMEHPEWDNNYRFSGPHTSPGSPPSAESLEPECWHRPEGVPPPFTFGRFGESNSDNRAQRPTPHFDDLGFVVYPKSISPPVPLDHLD
ncbi:uncharacterized protein [Watersipora subatra]|uniref:uncharacterized protein n=1 Tax=Watersipora subatra TaxID=2589382 RepID=UPI00355C3D78